MPFPAAAKVFFSGCSCGVNVRVIHALTPNLFALNGSIRLLTSVAGRSSLSKPMTVMS